MLCKTAFTKTTSVISLSLCWLSLCVFLHCFYYNIISVGYNGSPYLQVQSTDQPRPAIFKQRSSTDLKFSYPPSMPLRPTKNSYRYPGLLLLQKQSMMLRWVKCQKHLSRERMLKVLSTFQIHYRFDERSFGIEIFVCHQTNNKNRH